MVKLSKEKLETKTEIQSEKKQKKEKGEIINQRMVNEIFSHLLYWKKQAKIRLERVKKESKDKEGFRDAQIYFGSITNALKKFQEGQLGSEVNWITSLPTRRELELEKRGKEIGTLARNHKLLSKTGAAKEGIKILSNINREKEKRGKWLEFLKTTKAKPEEIKGILEEREVRRTAQKENQEKVEKELEEAEEKINKIFKSKESNTA